MNNAAPTTDQPCGPGNSYLADSQFDYPGQAHGWRYYALNAANEFSPLQALPASAATATPLAMLGCDDDPHARVGRDVLHPGYLRRPCIQWHPREGGSYLVSGEIALMNSLATGALNVRVIVDDVEFLSHDLVYPQVLTFELDVAVRAGGFVRLLFTTEGLIDHKEALFYLRARSSDGPRPPGRHQLTHQSTTPAAWQRLNEVLGHGQNPMAATPLPGPLAQSLFRPQGVADPALVQLLQEGAVQRYGTALGGFRKPRFFSIQRAPSSTPGPV